ncbi:hypothetical protein [Streptomyces sp. NPDC021562]|uniref:hypothetical protein n=1 Tax=Streptomyces sp. NPDC021562 TaxID=3155121 RepID=UPI0033C4FD63
MTSETLWYANRATGAVCLALFTVVVLLGIAVRLRTRLPGLPRFGTVALHRTLSLSATAFRTLAEPGPQGGIRTDISRWAGLVEGRGACHHPDGTVRLVRSALTTFATEIDAHANGHCTATDHTPLLPVPTEKA